MTKSLEALGYLNAKFDIEKQYPDQYNALKKDLDKLDRFINWKKVSGISAKQRSYAEAIAKTLQIENFDITQYDKKSIEKFFEEKLPMYRAIKEDEHNQKQKEEAENVDVPF